MEGAFISPVSPPAKRPYHNLSTMQDNNSNGASKRRSKPVPPPLVVPPGHVAFRLLCHVSKIGGVIGKSGSVVKIFRQETGAQIRIDEPVSDCEERVILIVAPENPKKKITVKGSRGEDSKESEEVHELSPAQEALLKVFERVLDVEAEAEGIFPPSGGVSCRLLAVTSQIGSVMGKGGKIIEKIRKESGAKIRVLPVEQLPACASANDEVIQMMGDVFSVKKALVAISRCLQVKPPSDKGQMVENVSVGAASNRTYPDPRGEPPRTFPDPFRDLPRTFSDPRGKFPQTFSDPLAKLPQTYADPHGEHPETFTGPRGDIRPTFFDPRAKLPQTYADPHGEHPRTFPGPRGEHPRTFPDPREEHPQTFPDPRGEHPRTFPDPCGEHPRTFPDPRGEHPRMFPDPRGEHPRTFPGPRGEHPRTFPEPRGEHPRTFPDPRGQQPRTFPDPRGEHPHSRTFPDPRGEHPQTFLDPHRSSNLPSTVGVSVDYASRGRPMSPYSRTFPDPRGEHPQTFLDPHRSSNLPSTVGVSVDYASRGRPMSTEVDRTSMLDPKRTQQEVSFKLLCSNEKVGGVIGKGGTIVRALQNETGTSISVASPVAESEERVITISALENPDMRNSPVQNAVVRVFTRSVEVGVEKGLDSGLNKGSSVSARVLVPSSQIGCLMGKGGTIISEMRKATGTGIRIIGGDQVPKCASENEEVVQIVGEFGNVKDALFHVTGRLRDNFFPNRIPNGTGGRTYSSSTIPEIPYGRLREPNSSSMYPPAALSHNHDQQTTLTQSMDHLGLSHSLDRPPSPRQWASQRPSGGNSSSRDITDIGRGLTSHRGGLELGSGSKSAIVTNTTVEIVVPEHVIGSVYGENGSNLSRLRQISGAKVMVHDPRPGTSEGMVIISGTPDQTQAAQSLLQAFIISGRSSPDHRSSRRL